MCSIFGYITKENIDVGVFQKCLQHRGPDGNGIYHDKPLHLVLGHSRLSIIDLSSVSNQPMLDEDEQYVLIFNGELYNYEEIRNDFIKDGYQFKTHSDTEVLLVAFKRYGRDCLSMLRGMFAFAIYDKNRSTLFLARDRFGIKPLYYTFHNNQFAFASEVTPMVESRIVPNVVSRKALDDFFYFGSVQQPDTIYQNIFALMPASYMEVDVKTLNYTTGKYYDFVEAATRHSLDSLTYNDGVTLIRQKLEEATRYHLVADVEVGAFLSGGVDSTAVVALMAKYSNKPIKTFSVGFSGKVEVEDETSLARMSAKALGCDHVDVIVNEGDIKNLFQGFVKSLDQPSIDGFNTYIVSEAAARSVKVVLSGLGGDEVFAGYEHFKLIQQDEKKNPGVIEKAMQHMHRIRPNRFTARPEFYGQDPLISIAKQRTLLSYSIRKALRRTPVNHSVLLGSQNLSTLQKISEYEVNHYLLNTLLRDSDVMSMAHSLECRPILLDHVLMENAFALPDRFKIMNGVKKSIFIDSVKDIIPAHVYQRKKTGFEMPLGSWMNSSLPDLVQESLNSQQAGMLFHENFIKKGKDAIQKGHIARSFWQSFVLLSWLNHSKAMLP